MKKQNNLLSTELLPTTKCRVCGSSKLIDIISLGNQKLSDFIEMEMESKIPAYPLDLILCEECYLLQLKHTTPPVELYTDRYGYRSGINQTMRNELTDVVSKAEGIVKLKRGDIVVDIGCNDGTTLSLYKTSGIYRIGFDPVKPFKKYFKQSLSHVSKDHYKYFPTFFSSNPYLKHFKKKSAKIITAISMFYDLDDPNEFLQDIKEIMNPDGILIIQQNYVAGMLKLCAFDNIVHEHLEYYSLESLENLLKRHDLEIFDVEEREINGGSFRAYIKIKGSPVKTDGGDLRVSLMRADEKILRLNNKKIYLNFASRVNKIRRGLRNFIHEEAKRGKKIYIYGASTRGNTLIQTCNLDHAVIFAAAERNTDKWGKKIASTNIPIIPEEEARKDQPDYFLALPWFFRDEFIEREREFLDKGGRIIIPLPTLELISSESGVIKVEPIKS